MVEIQENKIKNKNRNGYFSIDNDYIKSYAKYLGMVATAVYTSLCMHSDYFTKLCWPSMKTIAEEHGLERHAVSRALVKLEEWNIISAERAIDRKNKKRKNNVYTLLSKELWKKLPEEEESRGIINSTASHGTENTRPMVSKIPQDGTENASNKTQIIKPMEENTNCGQEPTVSIIPNQKENPREGQEEKMMVKESVPATEVWSYEQEIIKIKNSGQRDYLIIEYYFSIKKFSFDNKETFDLAFKRALKPANLLKAYDGKNIRAAMKWCNETYGLTTGWTLETVLKRIDDGIADGFVPQKIKRMAAELPAGSTNTPGQYKNIKVHEIKNTLSNGKFKN